MHLCYITVFYLSCLEILSLELGHSAQTRKFLIVVQNNIILTGNSVCRAVKI